MDPDMVKAVARGSAMVLEMGVLVVGGVFIGSKVDEAISTSPLFLLLLSSSMLVLGIYRIHRTLTSFEKSSGHKRDNS